MGRTAASHARACVRCDRANLCLGRPIIDRRRLHAACRPAVTLPLQQSPWSPEPFRAGPRGRSGKKGRLPGTGAGSETERGSRPMTTRAELLKALGRTEFTVMQMSERAGVSVEAARSRLTRYLAAGLVEETENVVQYVDSKRPCAPWPPSAPLQGPLRTALRCRPLPERPSRRVDGADEGSQGERKAHLTCARRPSSAEHLRISGGQPVSFRRALDSGHAPSYGRRTRRERNCNIPPGRPRGDSLGRRR